MVDETSLLSIASNAPSLEAACDRLIDQANANGGYDNCSGLLIDLGIPTR